MTNDNGTTPLSAADMAAIIQDEMRQWEATSYRLSLRARVQQKLGRTQNIKAIEDDMEQAEVALDLLRQELAALATEAVSAG